MSETSEHEWRITAEWDWVWLDEDDVIADDLVIHAVQTLDNEATADDDWAGVGKTECGRSGLLTIPGRFDRMGAPRCTACCNETGMPQGEQSPKNVVACRVVVERRLGALGLSSSPSTERNP